MPERSIVEPLSGNEVVEMVKYKVGEMLKRDCFLSPNMAYQSVQGSIRVSLRCTDVGHTPTIDMEIKINQGPPIPTSFKDPEDANHVTQIDLEQDIDQEPPNTVRIETEQPVPVLVEDGDGRKTIKRVTMARPKKGREGRNPAGGSVDGVKLPAAKE